MIIISVNLINGHSNLYWLKAKRFEIRIKAAVTPRLSVVTPAGLVRALRAGGARHDMDATRRLGVRSRRTRVRGRGHGRRSQNRSRHEIYLCK